MLDPSSAPDVEIVDVDLLPTPRQRLHSLLDAAHDLGIWVTIWARDYPGSALADVQRWYDTRRQRLNLTIEEYFLVDDTSRERVVHVKCLGGSWITVHTIPTPLPVFEVQS